MNYELGYSVEWPAMRYRHAPGDEPMVVVTAWQGRLQPLPIRPSAFIKNIIGMVATCFQIPRESVAVKKPGMEEIFAAERTLESCGIVHMGVVEIVDKEPAPPAGGS